MYIYELNFTPSEFCKEDPKLTPINAHTNV